MDAAGRVVVYDDFKIVVFVLTALDFYLHYSCSDPFLLFICDIVLWGVFLITWDKFMGWSICSPSLGRLVTNIKDFWDVHGFEIVRGPNFGLIQYMGAT